MKPAPFETVDAAFSRLCHYDIDAKYKADVLGEMVNPVRELHQQAFSKACYELVKTYGWTWREFYSESEKRRKDEGSAQSV